MCTRQGTVLCKNNRLVFCKFGVRLYLNIVFKVTPEVEIIFPRLIHSNFQEFGVCMVKAWPLLLTADVFDVFTNNNSCAIAQQPLTTIDIYTTAIFFALDHINSSCLYITCWTHLKIERKNIIISKC